MCLRMSFDKNRRRTPIPWPRSFAAFRSSTSAPKSWFFPSNHAGCRGSDLIVWLSFLEPGIPYDWSVPRFPALLDTGTNHNLLLKANHLSWWANHEVDDLTEAGPPVLVNGAREWCSSHAVSGKSVAARQRSWND